VTCCCAPPRQASTATRASGVGRGRWPLANNFLLASGERARHGSVGADHVLLDGVHVHDTARTRSRSRRPSNDLWCCGVVLSVREPDRGELSFRRNASWVDGTHASRSSCTQRSVQHETFAFGCICAVLRHTLKTLCSELPTKTHL
jgi:hypothetical protein